MSMFNLDVRSVILVAGLMSLLMSMVLFFLRRNFPPSIKGLGDWTVAPAIIFVATLLMGARGAIPDFFSAVVGNLLLFVGLSLLYLGSQRFFGQRASVRLWGGLIVFVAPLLFWFASVMPHYGMLLMTVSLFIIALSISHAILLLRHGARGFATYLTSAALLVLTATQTLRFIYALGLPPQGTLFNIPPAQTGLIAVYAFCTLLIPIGMVLMATEKLRGELEHLASHDSLTGALNRRALIEACEQEMSRCRRQHRATSLLMLDLDHFKAINDRHGHLAGDHVLTDFAARVRASLRRPDQFGRYGGEEFVVLLPETPLAGALIVAERIRGQVAAASEPPCCTVSIGATTWHDDDAAADALLARADAALYAAKAEGRNCVKATA